MKFGFLVEKLDTKVEGVRIQTLDDFDQVMDRFHEVGRVSKGFLLPPLRKAELDAIEKQKFKRQSNQVSSPWIAITETHEISSDENDEELERFLILSLAFLFGVYLGPAGSLAINRVPYSPGKLTGVVPSKEDVVIGLAAFLNYYRSTSPENRTQLKAVLHWFQLGQTYFFAWDRFDAQYKVLDGLSKLLGIGAPHATKPARLVEKVGIKMPAWTEIFQKDTPKGSKDTCELAEFRNKLVHEALFAGSPIGYSYPGTNFYLEFPAFNAKLISCLVGLKSPYQQAEPNNRCVWLWDFES